MAITAPDHTANMKHVVRLRTGRMERSDRHGRDEIGSKRLHLGWFPADLIGVLLTIGLVVVGVVVGIAINTAIDTTDTSASMTSGILVTRHSRFLEQNTTLPEYTEQVALIQEELVLPSIRAPGQPY